MNNINNIEEWNKSGNWSDDEHIEYIEQLERYLLGRYDINEAKRKAKQIANLHRWSFISNSKWQI